MTNHRSCFIARILPLLIVDNILAFPLSSRWMGNQGSALTVCQPSSMSIRSQNIDYNTDRLLIRLYNNDQDKESYDDNIDYEETDDELNDTKRPSYYSYAITLLSDAISKAVVTNKRQYMSLLNEQRKAEECEQIQYKANLILSNLWQIEVGATSVTAIDWEKDEEVTLVLDAEKYASPNEEADALFAKARKMKRGSNVVKDLITKNEKTNKILMHFENEMNNFACNFENNNSNGVMTESEEISLLSIWQRIFESSKKTGIKLDHNKPITIEEYDDLKDIFGRNSPKKSSKRKNKTAGDATTFRNFDSPTGLKVIGKFGGIYGTIIITFSGANINMWQLSM